MVIQTSHTPIREIRMTNCTFSRDRFTRHVAALKASFLLGLRETANAQELSDYFKCSCYVLVINHEKCDDDHIPENIETSPLNTNPVSGEYYKGGYHE